jgi:hypothetical protein
LLRRQSKRPLQRNIIMPALQAANRSWSITSTAIPTMNNPAIPMSAARAAFFLAHANEKQQHGGLPRLFADETTAPVLDPGRGRTKTGRLWAYAADDRPLGWVGSDCS